MSEPASERTTVKRIADRGVYERDRINAILDEALICHVGFVDDGQSYVIPTIHTRIDDRIYLHGARKNRMLRCLCGGAPACITVSLVDGLVLARSAFHHSLNYRSVVMLGTGREVTDTAEKMRVLDALMEHVIPGRLAEARIGNGKEVNATKVVSFPIEEASAKLRQGPPSDEDDDYSMSIWAGVLPLSLQAGTPIPDPRMTENIDVPEYVLSYKR
jgi:nitroimidazol reductase NimA-like FMN-containing flavoprotein (pyridoxamine 5'-phosphate oxidase superfamily)